MDHAARTAAEQAEYGLTSAEVAQAREAQEYGARNAAEDRLVAQHWAQAQAEAAATSQPDPRREARRNQLAQSDALAALAAQRVARSQSELTSAVEARDRDTLAAQMPALDDVARQRRADALPDGRPIDDQLGDAWLPAAQDQPNGWEMAATGRAPSGLYDRLSAREAADGDALARAAAGAMPDPDTEPRIHPIHYSGDLEAAAAGRYDTWFGEGGHLPVEVKDDIEARVREAMADPDVRAAMAHVAAISDELLDALLSPKSGDRRDAVDSLGRRKGDLSDKISTLDAEIKSYTERAEKDPKFAELAELNRKAQQTYESMPPVDRAALVDVAEKAAKLAKAIVDDRAEHEDRVKKFGADNVLPYRMPEWANTIADDLRQAAEQFDPADLKKAKEYQEAVAKIGEAGEAGSDAARYTELERDRAYMVESGSALAASEEALGRYADHLEGKWEPGIRAALQYAAENPGEGQVNRPTVEDPPVNQREREAAQTIASDYLLSHAPSPDATPQTVQEGARASWNSIQALDDFLSKTVGKSDEASSAIMAVMAMTRTDPRSGKRILRNKKAWDAAVAAAHMAESPTVRDAALVAADQLYKDTAYAGGARSGVKPPRESKGPALAAHIDTTSLRATADVVLRRFESLGITAHVWDSVDSMPPEVVGDRRDVRAMIHQDDRGRPVIHLVSDRIADHLDAQRAIEHEVIGHYLVEDLLGDRLGDVQDALTRGASRDEALGKLVARVERDYPASEGYSQADRANEVIAQALHEPRPPRGFRDVLVALKDALAAVGFDSLRTERRGTVGLRELQNLLTDVSASYSRGENARINRFNTKGYARRGQKLEYNEQSVLSTSWWQEAMAFATDRHKAMHMALLAMGEPYGPTMSKLRAMESDRARMIQGPIIEKLVTPIQDTLRSVAQRMNLTTDEVHAHVNDALQAKFALEANRWHQIYEAGLNPAASAERDRLMNSALEGKISPAEARSRLEQLVNDSTITEPGMKSDAVSVSGFTNEKAREHLDQLHPTFAEAVDAISPYLDGLRQLTNEHNMASGWWNPIITEMAGYASYVPRKGAERGDVRARLPWQGPVSAVDQKQNRAKGRREAAENGLTQLYVEAMDAVNRRVSNDLLASLASTIERDNDRVGAKAKEAEQRGEKYTRRKSFGETTAVDPISYENGKFKYPDRPSKFEQTQFAVHRDGETRVLSLNDNKVASTFSRARDMGDPLRYGLDKWGYATRILGRSMTAWSPPQMLTQITRDLQSTLSTAAFEYRQLAEQEGRQVGPLRMDTKILGEVATALWNAYRDPASRELFGSTAARRADILADPSWRTTGTPGEQKLRGYMAEMVEEGGMIGFASHYNAESIGSLSAIRDPLAMPAPARRAVDTLAKVGDTLERTASWLDNTYRSALYMALREHGMPKEEAQIRTRQTMDFNQRGSYADHVSGRAFQAAYLFVNPKLVGLSHLVEQRLWHGGQMPLEPTTLPDGRVEMRLKADWKSQVNTPLLAFLFGVGAMTAGLSYSMMGEDDTTGVANGQKVSAQSYMRSTILASGNNATPLKLPRQDGLHAMVMALGSAAALSVAGGHSQKEIVGELSSVLANSTLPITDLGPSLLQPIMQMIGNENAFGQVLSRPVDPRRPMFRSDSGFATTPQAYHDFARSMHEMTKGVVDMPPEWYRHLMTSYTGPLGPAVNRMLRQASGLDAHSSALGAAASAIIGSRWDTSGDSYETREYARWNRDTMTPLRQQLARARADDNPGYVPVPGKARPVGPLERQLIAANPRLDLLEKAQIKFEQMRGQQTRGIANARQAGDPDQVQQAMVQARLLTARFLKGVNGDDAALAEFTARKR